jgi:membrane protein involved in colicin uptake
MAAGAAHVSEHLGYAYRRKIEEELGFSLPHPDEKLPDDIEVRISKLVAQASAQLTGKAQKQAQAEENAKKQEDPIIQMQQKELAIKEQQAKDKAQAEMAKIQAALKKAQDDIAFKRAELERKTQIEGGKIAAKVAGDKLRAATESERMSQQQGTDAMRLGVDIGRIGLDAAIRMKEDSDGGTEE